MLPCSALLLASVLLPVSQGPRGVTVVRREGDQRLEGKRWVLLIGCDDYQSTAIPKLKYCVADTQSIAQELSGPGTTLVRLGTDAGADYPATRANILGRLGAIKTSAAPEDEVVVFFSGHGMSAGAGGEQYLLPCDADPNALEDTAVPLRLLRTRLQESRAGTKVLIVDACRSMARGPEGIDATQAAKGLFVLQSCAPGEISREDDARQHGRFSWWLAQGLAGDADDQGNRDGLVDFDELFSYCASGLREDAVKLGGQQEPRRSMEDAGAGVPILAGPIHKGIGPRPRPTGSLVISVTPVEAEAEVQVSSQPPQATQGGSLTLQGLPPGDLRVVVRAQGYQDETRAVRIEAGQATPLAVSLRPIVQPPIERPTPPGGGAPPTGVGTQAGQVKTITLPGGAKMDLVWVPAGNFMMGSNGHKPDEQPVHRVELDGFWIGRTEVTLSQFAEFVRATGYQTEAEKAGDAGTWRKDYTGAKGDYPARFVSWNDAKAFCDWAALSLPTEAQWEYAAAGPEGRVYPWGNAWDFSKVVTEWSKVGSRPAGVSWCGALDMAGNVWEWCLDAYEPGFYGTPGATAPNPENTNISSTFRVGRGSCWSDPPISCRSAFRVGGSPDDRHSGLGFRACQDAR